MAIIDAVSVQQGPTVHTLASSLDSLIVARGIVIASSAASTVVMSGSDNGIQNSGMIRGIANDGVSITGASNTVANTRTGIIDSDDDGILIFGLDSTVANSGLINGRWGVYYYSNAVGNTGTSVLINSGTIAGEVSAITHVLDEDISITNQVGGLIMSSGTDPVINSVGENSRMTLINAGRIFGDVAMGDDNDRYDGRGGRVFGDVRGELGDDTFLAGAAAERFVGGGDKDTLIFSSVGGVRASLDNTSAGTGLAAGDFYSGIENITGSATGGDVLRGNGAGNLVTGRGGNDVLFGVGGFDGLVGGAGADSLFGGADSDELLGGAGIDVLSGGLGAGVDAFILLSLSEAGDRITDFGNTAADNDSVAIQSTAVAGSGLALGGVAAGRFITRTDNVAQQADDRFVFRTTDRTLWYDANGNAAGGLTMLVDLQAGATLVASDISIFSPFVM